MDDYLLKLAEEANCIVTTKKTRACSSFIIEIDETHYINIDPQKFETDAQKRVALGHEIGHCLSGTTYSIHRNSLYRNSAEYRANFSAAKILVPIQKLLSCIKNGIHECYDLAEFFSVTQDFMEIVLYIYKNKGLLNEVLFKNTE